MMVAPNPNILFHITAGNPANQPVGMGLDKQIYGMSLGGQIFRSATLANAAVFYTYLTNGSTYLFDSIVPSDAIKNTVNYRAIFITNYAVESVILDTITCSAVVPDPSENTAITDVSIAVEGLYTVAEVSRPIPNAPYFAQNPSIVLDDEYDSTGKLSGLNFQTTLSTIDLPTDIPYNCVLKLWIKRTMTVNKTTLPPQQLLESFTLTVNEYDNVYSTPLQIDYYKLEGRIPLSNWFDMTITPGTGKPFLVKELLSQDVDLSTVTIVDAFVKKQLILIFYYVTVNGTNQYFLLVVNPNDVRTLNQYIQIMLTFDLSLGTDEVMTSRTLVDIKRSIYDKDLFYLFWADNITNTNPCTQQYFGYSSNYDRISVDMLYTTIWTGDASFNGILQSYVNRKVETYNIYDHKTVREYEKLINLEQFEDLFILFTQDTTNRGLLDIPNINLNTNEILYLFEKDIINPQKYSKFKTFPGIGAQVFSQRLYPTAIPTQSDITSTNNVRTPDASLIIDNSQLLKNSDISSLRRVKYLLDGTRYVDLNSVHGREFKVGNNFVTYEIPVSQTNLNNIFFTTSIAITNDTSIYAEKIPVFMTNTLMPNVVDSVIYPRPLFQQNIIDESSMDSASIPIEWADRVYIDQWQTIISTVPNISNQKPIFSLQYNFHRNLWQAVFFDQNGNETTEIYDYLSGQKSITVEPSGTNTVVTTGSSASSGSPGFGKLYTELTILDMPYVIEPDTYMPISVRISAQTIFSEENNQKYVVNFEVYFKGNDIPLVNVVTYTTNIGNLSYLFVNPNENLNIRMNYLAVCNSNDFAKEYYIKNVHASLLNQITTPFSNEILVNPQLLPNQAEFQYYRYFNIIGMNQPDVSSFEQDGDICIPIVLYGNGYLNDATNELSPHLGVDHPFDFTKITIDDNSMRFYLEGNTRSTLDFKIGYYDYSRDYAVIWLRLKDYFANTGRRILMFYGNNVTNNKKNILKSYSYLKQNIYPNNFFGAFHFDYLLPNNQAVFNGGKIFNAGEPVIYQTTPDNQLKLTKIDKEYMYGIAKIYKSEKFDLDIAIPQESDLIFDPNIKPQFFDFVTNLTKVLKPGYTQINNIQQSGISVLEAGECKMGVSTNKNVSGLVAMTPNSNVNTYYSRYNSLLFNLLTSFNGYDQSIDFVVSKPIDSTIFKSGVFKINGKLKSETIKFLTPFKDNDYFVFFSMPSNQKLYWNQLCPNRFTITASSYLVKEISWMAFHKDIFGGVYTPNSIFCGQRTLTGSVTTSGGESPTTPNLTNWYNNELLIQPSVGVQGDPGSMLIDPVNPGYALLFSANQNINTYWTTKQNNQFNVKTSSPTPCTVHWLVIQNGIEWWNELM